MSPRPLRYRAFISYSHADSKAAGRLHRRLESYRLPRAIRITQEGDREIPPRISPVFRDRDELASSTELSDSIEQALDESETLIVLCSPAAVASPWVDKEIQFFRRQHPERPVFGFVTAGDPALDPRRHPDLAAIPVSMLLKNVSAPDGDLGEPLAADARPGADGFTMAFLKLASGLLGVRFDQLRRRDLRRRQQRWTFAAAAGFVLALLFGLLAWQATVARDHAQAAQALAEMELTSERQTRNFLLSVFRLADPGEARGNSVTVREVLDSAVSRIDASEFSRPVIRSRFLATMGQAYSSLGINRRSVELMRHSLQAMSSDDSSPEAVNQRIDTRIELADVLFDMGEYEKAEAELRALAADEPAISAMRPAQAALMANVSGDIASYQERDTQALQSYQHALAVLDGARITAEEDASLRSRALGGIALLRHFAGDYDASLEYFSQALELLLPVFGRTHPDTIWAMTSKGSAAYSAGDYEVARQAWQKALDASSQLFDRDNPEVATIKNNLARLEFESGNNRQAEILLREVLAIDRVHRSKEFDDLVFPLNNLALVRAALGDDTEAEALLAEAHEIASGANHRWLGPVMANLADLYCRTGRVTEGLALAGQSVIINAEKYGRDDWRSQRAVLVEAYCGSLSGRSVESEELSLQAERLIQRWGALQYYGLRARQHVDAIR